VALVDAVVVSFNSREHLRQCVEPLAATEGVHAVVVDNASTDDTLATISDLPVRVLRLERNGGFAHGCNAGWRAGSAPYVLFLNPDAVLDEPSLLRLVDVLESHPSAAIAAPRILEADGSLDLSQRRFPRLRSTYANALFLHRLFRRATWASELVRDRSRYERPGSPEWVSGACMLVRRRVLETLDGMDEGFFMYCEDKDLCKRAHDAGHDVRYEPTATAVHVGGASAPRAALLPVLATSRIRYARKHRGRVAAALERGGVALGALTHIVVSRGGRAVRAGHARSLVVASRGIESPPPHAA
jgi:GT2 family glycosyltransferase